MFSNCCAVYASGGSFLYQKEREIWSDRSAAKTGALNAVQEEGVSSVRQAGRSFFLSGSKTPAGGIRQWDQGQVSAP
jgi:hypothetical protein